MSMSSVRGLSFLLLLPVTVYYALGSARKAMVPDDLFRLQTIGTVAISSAGDAAAYVVQRPSSTSPSFGRLYLWGNDRADVWVASTADDASPRNVTNGETDGSGFWAPQWSPDGRWLAMLSTRGGNVRLWVWSKDSGTIHLLSDGGVDPRPDTFSWISGSRIVFWTLPGNHKVPSMAIDHETPEIADSEWAKAFAGKASTASVLDSGKSFREIERVGTEDCQLFLADLDTKKNEVLARTSVCGEFAFATIQVSPNRRSIAFLQQRGVIQPGGGINTVELLDADYELIVMQIGSERSSVRLEGVRQPFWGSVRWSPDAAELAVIGYEETANAGEALFRCSIASKLCRPVTTGNFHLRRQRKNVVTDLPYLWFGDHTLAVRGATRNAGLDGTQEYWKINSDEGGFIDLPLLTSTKDYPNQVLTDGCSRDLIAAGDRTIWKINPEIGVALNLVRDSAKIISVEQVPTNKRACSVLVVTRLDASQTRSYFLDSRSGTLEPIVPPAPGARLVAVDGQLRALAFQLDDNTGSYLWLSRGGRSFKTLLRVNQFLQKIEPGDLKAIKYSSLDGQALRGWVILPPEFKPACRYPVVTWVYVGTVYGEGPPGSLVRINENHPLNLQLLAAHGYVVLMPSMPLPSASIETDPYMELSKGVLPAIDKLVQMGIADPRRVAVIGQSYGGYSAYGLITQTNRFRAAVVLAGISDLVSLYGIFDARTRYDSTGYGDSSLMWNVEGMGMGTPPWTDLERYIRNSPITYVSRVQTPLLIIQGDLDYIPIQQGEEFFSALYRQNLRAEFVRYWGEDHLLTSPANIRDMWQRIYTWLDTFLRMN